MSDPFAHWKKGDPIDYIRKEIPSVTAPTLQGDHYEDLVPDTLDIAERAELAVNGLTRNPDPDADFEIYWWVMFLRRPPVMMHDWNDVVQCKWHESLPLMRLMSGSGLNMQIDQRWMEVVQQEQGPDGLLYLPEQGRPWCHVNVHYQMLPLPAGGQFAVPFYNARILGAISLYGLLTGDPLWKKTGELVVQGLKRTAVHREDCAFYADTVMGPGYRPDPNAAGPLPDNALISGILAQGLTQFARTTGYEPALDLAAKLVRFIKTRSGGYGPDGQFLEDRPGVPAHFHLHTIPLLALLDFALTRDDADTVDFVRRGFEYGKAAGYPLVGYFQERIGSPAFRCSETCEVADMIGLALKLSAAGAGDFWDDADRWIRNQFAENQLQTSDWPYWMHAGGLAKYMPLPTETAKRDDLGIVGVYETGENIPQMDPRFQTNEQVPERNMGLFAGVPSPNDFHPNSDLADVAMMHCCAGNGTRALYYIWEHILTCARGTLRVNLLLNRASPWADVHSHIPYTGQVDVRIKQPVVLQIRIPQWVSPSDAQCRVNGEPRRLNWQGRYAEVGTVKPGDQVSLTFPIAERTTWLNIEKHRYGMVLRGNEVVYINPPGEHGPLYQRAHYRQAETRWRKINRFVPKTQIDW